MIYPIHTNHSKQLLRAAFAALLGLSCLALVSCSDDDRDPIASGLVRAAFTTAIGGKATDARTFTRAFDDSWTAGDLVGIHMTPDNSLSADAKFSYYEIGADGTTLSYHTTDDALFYPTDNTPVRFFAFYPYHKDNEEVHDDIVISDNKVTYKMLDQSTRAKLEGVDFLYCRGNEKYNASFPNANLTFRHKLSKVVVHVKRGGSLDKDLFLASGLELSNLPATVTCDLNNNGTPEAGALSNEALIPYKETYESNDDMITFTAIVPPHALSSTFTFDLGPGIDLTHDLDETLESGKSYIYTFNLNVSSVNLTGTQVINWDTGVEEEHNYGESVEGANCYMVKPNGSVLIPVRHAHRFYNEMNKFESSNVSFLGEKEAFYVEVLWTDTYAAATEPTGNNIAESDVIGATGAIKSVAMDTPGCFGYINVETGDKEGNAVVALRRADANGDILFSWHIWVTSYDPSTNMKCWDNGDRTTYFMDRNLGATSAANDSYGSFGLLYQWGRKDPIVGTRNALYTDKEPFVWLRNKGASTYMATQPYEDKANNNGYESSGSQVTIATSLGTPFTFYHFFGDWCKKFQSTAYLLRWNNLHGKPFDDPCPPGWKVPPYINNVSPWNGLYHDENKTPITNWEWNNTLSDDHGGRTNSEIGWWPAAGIRYYTTSAVTNIGVRGSYWGGRQTTAMGGRANLKIITEKDISLIYNCAPSEGGSVRCVAE